MGEMAEATFDFSEDEFYEDRLIATCHAEGMSVSAIGAKLNIPVDDVIESLKWSRSLRTTEEEDDGN